MSLAAPPVNPGIIRDSGPASVEKVYNPLTIYLRAPLIRVAGISLAACRAMLGKIARLFVIKTRFEAMAVTYALAVGAVGRGSHYLIQYPGIGGWLLLAACTGSVFMAGARLMEMTRSDSGQRRRRFDLDGDWSDSRATLALERRLRCTVLRATSDRDGR